MLTTKKKILIFVTGIIMATFFLGLSVVISIYANHLAIIFDPILVGFAIATLTYSAQMMGFRIRANPMIPMSGASNNHQSTHSKNHFAPSKSHHTRQVFYKEVSTKQYNDEHGVTHQIIRTKIDVKIPALEPFDEFDSDIEDDTTSLMRSKSAPILTTLR